MCDPPWGHVRPSTVDLADDAGGSPKARRRGSAAAGDHGGWTELDHNEGDSCCRSLVALSQVGRGCAGFGDRRNLTKGEIRPRGSVAHGHDKEMSALEWCTTAAVGGAGGVMAMLGWRGSEIGHGL